MTTTCHTCETRITFWTDVTYTTDGRTFCSLRCVYRYRGKAKIA